MASERGSGSKQAQLHFVLVHGAGHGAWCWYKIRTLLEGSGHKVTCIDLKCSGIDCTDFNTVFTFAEYNEPLITFISSLLPNQKVVLVGHSAGGSNVTDAMHKFAEKIQMVIYVAADMSKYGYETSADIQDIKDYEYIYGLGPDQPPTGVMVKPELRRKVLYNLSPIEDSTLASMLLRPAPARALQNGVTSGGESVPRVFIMTLKDKLFKPENQEEMIKQWPPSKVFATESDHSPFFSTPDVLFGLLIEATASIKCN